MPATTLIQPYLFFDGRCEEAIEFYRKAIGAKVVHMMRYKESPEAPPPGMVPAGYENKVMHATLDIGGAILMASDACGEKREFDGFRLSLAVSTKADAERAFAALSQGGTVMMPLTKTFWSSCFGMLTDRFGLGWMVSIIEEHTIPKK